MHEAPTIASHCNGPERNSPQVDRPEGTEPAHAGPEAVEPVGSEQEARR